MIELDGSYLEGGGQIVRTALALSALTGKAFKVTKIRTGRAKPGLKAQHLYAIRAVAKICDANYKGAAIASKELEFIPGKLKPSKFEINIGTAGSITLLLQALLLPSCFVASNFRIIGGTNVAWSMPIEYFENVLLRHYKNFAEIKLNLIRRGYYPKGGGIVDIATLPKTLTKTLPKIEIKNGKFEFLKKIELVERGELIEVKGISHAAKFLQKRKVAERQRDAAINELSKLNCQINIDIEYAETFSPGSGLTLWAIFKAEKEPIVLGADFLGDPKLTAEDVGKKAALKLMEEIDSGACVDEHLADNLIPIMALAEKSAIKVSKISNHTLTNMYVVENFLGKMFEIENNIIKKLKRF